MAFYLKLNPDKQPALIYLCDELNIPYQHAHETFVRIIHKNHFDRIVSFFRALSLDFTVLITVDL